MSKNNATFVAQIKMYIHHQYNTTMKKILLLLALVACALTTMAQEAKQNPNEEVQYVVNNCPVTPVREEPSEAAEQATQLLFGDVCELLERRSSWAKIRSTLDGQVGWVSYKMMTPVVEEAIQAKSIATVAIPMAVATDIQTGEKRMLTIGTRLPNYKNGSFELLGKRYKINRNAVYRLSDNGDKVLVNGKPVTAEDVVRVAQQLLNVAYLWGGKNMMGYDCSGFTQTVYGVFGINLLRNAREQVTQGEVVASLAEAQPGDLVFFDHADRDPNATRITHVGMLISPTQVLHCSGCVHIDRIDENGIYLSDGTMTHHLAQIKRYL